MLNRALKKLTNFEAFLKKENLVVVNLPLCPTKSDGRCKQPRNRV